MICNKTAKSNTEMERKMNTLWIGVIVILVLSGILGWKRGLIRTIFSLFSLMTALLLAYWISPVISKSLQKNEKVMDYYTQKVDEFLNLKETGKKLNEQIKIIEELPVPESIKKSLIDNNKEEIYQALDAESFSEYLTNSIACFILNAMVFFVIFLLVRIGLHILCFVLDIISKLPILNELNHFAGLAVGVLQGLLSLWIACTILTACSGTQWGQDAMNMIGQSKLLSVIYNNNLILKYITNLSKLLL